MQCLVNSKYSIILKLSCPGDCLIFKFPCFLPRNGSAILSRGFLDGVEEAGTEEDEAIVQASKLTMKEQALGERRERRDPV